VFNPFHVVGDAMDMAARSALRGLRGHKRYSGSSRDIARAIVRDCWNGTYIQGSAGHFHQFWVRDLGMCTPALVRMGMREEVHRSLAWALEVYERAGRVTTTIFPGRRPIDIYVYGSDSLPFLVYSLRVIEAVDLVQRHRPFLQAEVDRFYALLLDPETGLVTRRRTFAEPKDCMKKSSSTFSNAMLAFLAKELEALGGFSVPFDHRGFASRLCQVFWRGDHFIDDLSGEDLVSGDANTWPFWLGVVEDESMLSSALATLEREGLTRPFPLRYFTSRIPGREHFYPRIFTPNYQGDTIWPQVGMVYIDLLARIRPAGALEHLRAYGEVIEREGNFLEVHSADGRPYKGRLGIYRADEGMIWAAMYLDLAERLGA
jgi:hypothetical protein